MAKHNLPADNECLSGPASLEPDRPKTSWADITYFINQQVNSDNPRKITY